MPLGGAVLSAAREVQVPILALLSKRSAERLQLRPQSHVHCLIKSLAVRSARRCDSG